MRLGARDRAESAVKVLAALNKLHRLRYIYGSIMQTSQQGQNGQCTIRKARVDLAPLVAGKRSVGLLQTFDEIFDLLTIYYV